MRLALPRISVLTLAILVVNAGLLVAIVERLLGGTEAAALVATPADRITLPPLAATSRREPEDLSAIRDRALFHASRRYVAAAAVAQSVAPPHPDYRLVGTLVIPRKPTVALLLHPSTQARRKVKPGDDLDGWRVQAVENRRVLLSHGTHAYEILADRTKTESQSGLSVVPMVRTATPRGTGLKVLTGTGRTSIAAAPAPADSEPRLYRPPPQ